MTDINSVKNITEEMLADLRVKVGKNMTQKRYLHTLGVEKMASAISDLYCPERKNILRAAALLHDITKAYDTEKHVELLKKYHCRTASAAPNHTSPNSASSFTQRDCRNSFNSHGAHITKPAISGTIR